MDKNHLRLVVNNTPAPEAAPKDGPITPEEVDELLDELGDYGTSVL